MNFETNYKLENYIINTKYDDFPDEIKERAYMCSLDLFCALILGAKGKQCQIGRRVAKNLNLSGNIVTIGSNEKYNLFGATIVFGHSSNSFDIDDGYNMIKGHPGTSFIAGMLSAAIEKNITYKDFLTTLVICYEVTIRWALAMQDHYKFLHSTGTYGAFGTVAGIGKIYNFCKEKLNNALSIADYHAPMTPVMRAVEYPSMNKDGVPYGAMIGALAIFDTLEGETGKTHLLELPEYKYLLDSLSQKYFIRDLYFKPYTCCRWAHQPIKACIDLLNNNRISFVNIEKVIIHTFDSAARLSKKIPNDTDEAQYNIAYPVACSIVYGDVGFEQVNDNSLKNQDVLNVMDKLEFVVDEELNSRFPEERLAYVEIITIDKKVYKSKIYCAEGEHTDPNLSISFITEKFKKRTASMFTKSNQTKIVDMLLNITNKRMNDIINDINLCFEK